MLPVETFGYLLVAAILGLRAFAPHVAGIVAVLKADRGDIPAIMRALARAEAKDSDLGLFAVK